MANRVRRRYADVLGQLREIRNYESRRGETIYQFVSFWKAVYAVISVGNIHKEDTAIIDRLWQGISKLIMETPPKDQRISFDGLTEVVLQEVHDATAMQAAYSTCQNCIVQRLANSINSYEKGNCNRYELVGQVLYIIMISIEAKKPFVTREKDGELVVKFAKWDCALSKRSEKEDCLISEPSDTFNIKITDPEVFVLINHAWIQLGYERIIACLETFRDE